MMNPTAFPLLRTDSYGKIFLYTTERDVACVPRHQIKLRDPVDPVQLLEAVKKSLLRFPHMMLGIEQTETQYRYRILVEDPVVLPFDGLSQRYRIGSSDTHHYLFLVGYHDTTIYMEYQHSISDGRGFEEFIRCVLFEYLKLCGYPVENDGSIRALDSYWRPEESEDGYRKLDESAASSEGIYQKPEALHAPTPSVVDDSPEIVTDITFPLADIKRVSKEYGVSPLTIIAPVFSRAFFQKFGTGQDKPVIAQIPVDLRPIVPTDTTRYFICFIDLPYEVADQTLPLPDVFRKTKAFLNSQLAPSQLLFRAKRASDTCLELHESALPLAEKIERGGQTARDFVLEDSFLITNVGQFRLPPSMEPYVLSYGAVLPCAAQSFAMLISSYQETMKLSIAQRDNDLQVCQDTAHLLHDLGIPARLESYPFRVTKYSGVECCNT